MADAFDSKRACLCLLLEDAKAGDFLLVEMPTSTAKTMADGWNLRAVHYGAQVRRDDVSIQ